MSTATRPGSPAKPVMSKSQRAYDFLKERILDKRYTPGYRLPLSPLAADLRMSVVPVREAIRRLEAEGYVDFVPNVGARVAIFDVAEYEHSMQTLGVVEGVATALSAPLLDTSTLARAEAINDRLRALVEHLDPHTFTQVNQEFHSVLFEPCTNPHILDLVHRGWARMNNLRDSTFAFVPGRAQESVDEHAEILTLIRNDADPLEIEMAARRHRWRTMDAYLHRKDIEGPDIERTDTEATGAVIDDDVTDR